MFNNLSQEINHEMVLLSWRMMIGATTSIARTARPFRFINDRGIIDEQKKHEIVTFSESKFKSILAVAN